MHYSVIKITFLLQEDCNETLPKAYGFKVCFFLSNIQQNSGIFTIKYLRSVTNVCNTERKRNLTSLMSCLTCECKDIKYVNTFLEVNIKPNISK